MLIQFLDLLKTYPVIFSALINVTAITLVAILSNYLILRRERTQWANQEVYRIYTETINLLSDLQACSLNINLPRKPEKPFIYNKLMIYLSQLSICCCSKDAESIQVIISTFSKRESYYHNYSDVQEQIIKEEIQINQKRIIEMMESDPRLKDLFRV